jgi:hypothetical protein
LAISSANQMPSQSQPDDMPPRYEDLYTMTASLSTVENKQ